MSARCEHVVSIQRGIIQGAYLNRISSAFYVRVVCGKCREYAKGNVLNMDFGTNDCCQHCENIPRPMAIYRDTQPS